jgi:hypothetical protein
MGLLVLSPKELEEFLHQEMHRDFSNLGIEIEDFLSDLMKTRQEEDMSFTIYNKYIFKQQTQNAEVYSPISSSPIQPQSENLAKYPLHTPPIENKEKKISPNNLIKKFTTDQESSATSQAAKSITTETHSPSTTLLKKFAKVSNTNSNPSNTIDKPIILKQQEKRHHIHRYDLRIRLKESRSEEEEQRVLQGLLEEFFDTILSADQSILIGPMIPSTTFPNHSRSRKWIPFQN